MSNKVIKIADIELDDNMDADDEGQRYLNLVKDLSADHNIVNLVTIHLNRHMAYEQLKAYIRNLEDSLSMSGLTNFVLNVDTENSMTVQVDYLIGDKLNDNNN